MPQDVTPADSAGDFNSPSLSQDLRDLDRAIAAATEYINALSRPQTAESRNTAAEGFVALKNILTEFRDKTLLLHSEIARQKEMVRAVQDSLPGKVEALGRNAGRQLKRSASRVLSPSGKRALKRLVGLSNKATHPDQSAKDPSSGKAPSHSQQFVEPSTSSPALDRTALLEQAVHQMRAPRGLDAWSGYVSRAVDFVDAEKLDVKAIAFYVPRFYRIPEEDGAQKPESNPWTGVCEAVPQYLGHYQPRFPGELGFYDQRMPGVLRQQAELARQYGIYGFCFHHYWSDGKHLLSQPLKTLLADPTLNLRFCVCWMNWSSLLPKDKPSSEEAVTEPLSDEVALLASLEPVFSDPRYIRIDGKPVLLVRAPGAMPNIHAVVKRWRQSAKQMGLPDLYLAGWVGSKEPADFDIDAAVEFPPDDLSLNEITQQCSLIEPDFAGHVYSYRSYVERHRQIDPKPFVSFSAVMTSWDDEPLHPGAGTSFAGATPALYARWLDHCCRRTLRHKPEERLLFVHAWNNWAEGAHLEPDRRFGYAYLQATANTLRRYQDVAETRALVDSFNKTFTPQNQVAIVFHCHYEDLIAPVFERYLSRLKGADLFVTVHPDISPEAVKRMHQLANNVYFICEENRGRDIRPFLIALRRIQALGYVTACKIHTKKTPQVERAFGESWRERLIGSLLGSEQHLDRVTKLFQTQRELGILAPAHSLLDLRIANYHQPNRYWLDRLLQKLARPDLIGNYAFAFPAGSMYWFRVDALADLHDLIPEDSFEEELGQRDGTLAHAVERIVSLYAQQRGFSTREISDYPQA